MITHAVVTTVLAGSLVAPAATPNDAIDWGPCPEDVVAAGVECGTLDVPLDYRDTGGRTIEIAISRLASTNRGKRHGILLTNSGGPGGPGLGYPNYLRRRGLPQSVLDTYDVIGMDPRGVDRSSPVTCDLTPEQMTTNIPLYARTQADVTSDAAAGAVRAAQCGKSSTAALLPHITTANTARDLDRVRAALGEPTASYFGVSYGTYLGAVWATLFPRTGDRVLLDSATAPGGWDADFNRLLGRGVEERFPDFARFVTDHPEYGLGRTPAQVRAKFFALAAKLDAEPRPDGIEGRFFRHLTFAELYYDRRFPALAEMWKAFDTGAPLPSGAAAETPEWMENYLASQLHVICNDSDWPEPVASYRRNVETDRRRHPLFGAAAANITACASWPSEPIEPPVRITGRGPSNVLILQNLRDPATPLAGALEMRRALGGRARMVTADQGGHVAYLELTNPCADEITTTFLVTGRRPERDVRCGA